MADNFPTWMNYSERKIVGALLDAALADETVTITVNDGEDDVVRKSRDRAKIEHETCQTDQTYYAFYRGKERLGWVWLVHGNDEDVMTDCSTHEWVTALVDGVSEREGLI